MKERLMKLSTPMKLAILAGLLGFIALLIGNPSNRNVIDVNAKEMTLATVKNHDRIDAMTLADWLIKENADYTLVDLRSEKEFGEYNIPTSVNIPIESILNSDLMRNQKILLYGNDDVASAQVWFILKSSNYKAVYILKGGLNAWKNEILFPKLDAFATTEQAAAFEKVKQVSLHFGGTPQIISGGTATIVAAQTTAAPTMPKLTAPAGKVGGGAKKKKEGC
ncbi:MAG: rhodanese domain-containing protein [Stygiobacter sp.]|nr:MAG: rhodanese domain-containing protein [Stygiobacter sp.]KAF0215102.1 MAG: rhodanese domain-containing [Ignavibacteria bacterium]